MFAKKKHKIILKTEKIKRISRKLRKFFLIREFIKRFIVGKAYIK